MILLLFLLLLGALLLVCVLQEDGTYGNNTPVW
jgi:hypothetical protein